MERRIEELEYEQLMLSRYTVAQHRSQDAMDRSVYLLLSRIDALGPMSIGELSEAFLLDASTLQRQTGAAMRTGVLMRIPDPDGGLARKFALTEQGRAQLRDVREHSVEVLHNLLTDWPDDDVNRFAELMRRFNSSIEDYRRLKASAAEAQRQPQGPVPGGS